MSLCLWTTRTSYNREAKSVREYVYASDAKLPTPSSSRQVIYVINTNEVLHILQLLLSTPSSSRKQRIQTYAIRISLAPSFQARERTYFPKAILNTL